MSVIRQTGRGADIAEANERMTLFGLWNEESRSIPRIWFSIARLRHLYRQSYAGAQAAARPVGKRELAAMRLHDGLRDR